MDLVALNPGIGLPIAEQFALAAYRAGWRDARACVAFDDKPLLRGALRDFHLYWERGWRSRVESTLGHERMTDGVG